MPLATSRRSLFGGALAVGAMPALPVSARADRIRLSLNENAWGPSPRVRPAVEAALGRANRYVEVEAEAFTRQVAAFEGVAPEQVILGEVLAPLGLHLALGAGTGSRFVHTTPGYAGFTDPAAVVGGTLDGVPLNADLENDLPRLLEQAQGATALFVVNPHNPSGTISDASSFHAFLREASQRTLVVVDEAYLEYSDDYAGLTAAPLVAEGLNVVVFRTLAKAYGLAGLQLGYALAPGALAATLKARDVGAPRSLDQLGLAAGAAALSDQAHIARVAAATVVERDLWHAELDALGWPRSLSQANFVFFRAPRPQAEIARLLSHAGIDIGRPHRPLGDWTRISIGLADENVRTREVLRQAIR